MPARRRNFPTPREMKEMEREQNERRREKEREEMEARRRQRAAEAKAEAARRREEAARRREEEARRREEEAKLDRKRTLRSKARTLKAQTAKLKSLNNRLDNIKTLQREREEYDKKEHDIFRANRNQKKHEAKAKRVKRYRQRVMRDSHGKFIPRIEEVSATQLKAPKPPKPPKPQAIKYDNTQQLKTLSKNVETLKTRTAQLKEMNDKLNTLKTRTAKLENTINAEPKAQSSRHKGWKQAYLVLQKTSYAKIYI